VVSFIKLYSVKLKALDCLLILQMLLHLHSGILGEFQEKYYGGTCPCDHLTTVGTYKMRTVADSPFKTQYIHNLENAVTFEL
jgi:ribosome recycling factor